MDKNFVILVAWMNKCIYRCSHVVVPNSIFGHVPTVVVGALEDESIFCICCEEEERMA